MHTTKIDNSETGETYVFNYNGDYSGDILLLLPDTETEEIKIPFSVLAEFIGSAFQNIAISKIEDQRGIDFLRSHA